PLAYSAATPPSAAAVQAALNGLSTMAAIGGPISVTTSNPAGPTTTYTLTFGGPLAGFNQGLVTVTATAPVIVSTAPATTVTGTGSLAKVGTGTLELSGTSYNNYSGGTFVNAGTLLLNKQDTGATGLASQPNATGTGNVTVGDEVGGADADVLRYGVTAGVDQ